MSEQGSKFQMIFELSGFQRDILSILWHLGPSKGLKIKSELHEMHTDDINHGRLYHNLDQLVEKGLVDKSERDGRTNEYAITESAQKMMEQYTRWLNDSLESTVPA